MSTNVPPEIVAALRTEARSSKPAAALRTIAGVYGIGRTELAWAATESYENILTPEIQAIWQWDLRRVGRGHTDDELNLLLSHLVPST